MMIHSQIIVVMLRRPSHKQSEMRKDPFWEFGSFGRTGCHKNNLMNPKKIHLIKGTRLAFAQGGGEGFKLVYLTPPVKTVQHDKVAEVKWHPHAMPFKYTKAPLIINNDGKSDFPSIRDFIEDAQCTSWESKLSSKFRSRREPVNEDIANEIVKVFEQWSSSNETGLFASTYVDALPYPPPIIDHNRKRTYLESLGNPVCGRIKK